MLLATGALSPTQDMGRDSPVEVIQDQRKHQDQQTTSEQVRRNGAACIALKRLDTPCR
jgi:hypothetical protein